jgi:hypothetical protein
MLDLLVYLGSLRTTRRFSIFFLYLCISTASIGSDSSVSFAAHHWVLACIFSLDLFCVPCATARCCVHLLGFLAFHFEFYSIPLAVVMLCDPLPVGVMLLPTIVWSAAHETWWQVRARSNRDTVSSAIAFHWGVFTESEFT